MTILRFFGLRHICREPSGLHGYVREDTHLVGQDTGAITLWATVFLRVILSGLGTQWVLPTGVLDGGWWDQS